jgi:serine/threonine-protein kinase
MGVVWSARNELTSGQVALKLILGPGPELRLRLLREAQACCSIQHKNVIQIHDVGQTDSGDPFLVMELLSGETLADLLARKRRLNQREAAVIGRDVARALSAAHDKGIVHRDLKPANIFLHNQPGEEARVVKVLDFGVSKNLLAADGLQTMMGGAIGSPSYMSPEQARGARDIDARADIWSLGVLLFEMLTGERPFLGEAREVIGSILDGEIPLVSRRVRGIEPGLERLIAGCLTRDREQRTWPIADVASGLEAFAEGGARSATPTLTALWGVPPAVAAPPSSRPRSGAPPSSAPSSSSSTSTSMRDSESDAETQKLEVESLAMFASPRPVLVAEMPASLPYDPTVRMFSATPAAAGPTEARGAVAGVAPPLPLPAAIAAAVPPPLPALPPPLPLPSPLPLEPREAPTAPPLADHPSSKSGDIMIARAVVGFAVAAVVAFLALSHRPASSAVVAPGPVVSATPEAEHASAPASAVEEVTVPLQTMTPDAGSLQGSPSTVANVETAPRPRPRVAAPRPLPKCGRFVKAGCDSSAPSKP